MRLSSTALAVSLSLSLLPLFGYSTPVCDRSPSLLHPLLHSRDDEHMHSHPGQPMAELNESQILQWHLPTPPSYWSIDIDGDDPGTSRYPALIALHALFLSLAFFVALPAGIAIRSSKPAWHGFTTIAFYSLVALGCAASGLYRKLTPDMYEGSTHSTHGYIVLLLCLSLSAVDIAAFFIRLYSFVRSNSKLTLKTFWRTVVLGEQQSYDSPSEYSGLVAEDPEDFDDMKPTDLQAHEPHSAVSDHTVFDAGSPARSRHSDETLHDVVFPPLSRPKQSLLARISKGAFATLERFLVFAAFGMVLSGIVVYTGGCRDSYINGCLAHLIKGGIFWCYGLFTFARFLGSHAEMGWAWNISPIGNTISAEFVESLVIFLYGITNTWMERFGAKAGDPYTTKQVQHISIAVMFWFAGLVGMGIESRRVRRWLAASSTAPLEPARSKDASEPPSYRASFNPFPALVIGVTGAAMSAHAQAYVFQVQIHELWGWLLLGFSVLRCLTYFFLWLGPPNSVLPSRPPTEALGSFFLACGGLMFMFSTEELTIAAMRRGRDDMMMFLNVAVAITCFAFCWTLSIVTFNGWLKARKMAA